MAGHICSETCRVRCLRTCTLIFGWIDIIFGMVLFEWLLLYAVKTTNYFDPSEMINFLIASSIILLLTANSSLIIYGVYKKNSRCFDAYVIIKSTFLFLVISFFILFLDTSPLITVGYIMFNVGYILYSILVMLVVENYRRQMVTEENLSNLTAETGIPLQQKNSAAYSSEENGNKNERGAEENLSDLTGEKGIPLHEKNSAASSSEENDNKTEEATEKNVSDLSGEKGILFQKKNSAPSSSKENDAKNEIPESLLCSTCLTRKRNVLLMDCKHLAVCSKCAKKLEKCPVCRRLIKRKYVKINLV